MGGIAQRGDGDSEGGEVSLQENIDKVRKCIAAFEITCEADELLGAVRKQEVYGCLLNLGCAVADLHVMLKSDPEIIEAIEERQRKRVKS